MKSIRPFVIDDIPSVSDLFISTFRGKNARREGVLSYFESIYFQNPWVEEDLPSLVYEGRHGEILGFLGVVPRRMRLKGESILAAVVGNLMVDLDASGRRDPFAAIELLRRFMAGKQDLSLTDTAVDDSRRIWEAAGGYTSRLYSLHWSLPFRKLAFLLGSRAKLSPLAALTRTFSRIVEPARSRRGPFEGCAAGVMSLDDLLDGLSEMQLYYSLRPDYEPESLAWLLEKAAEKRGRGELKRTSVRDRSGRRIGWYIYFLNSHGTSRVLQLAATHEAIDQVFACLVNEAERAGTDGLVGRLDSRFMSELSSQGCRLSVGPWVLAHARNPSLLDPLKNGDAFFSGLEGEWWMRFMEDSFAA